MSKPRVTVAIPTRNRSMLLLETIKSVQAQSFDDFEIIVSDNASTDDTADVVAGLADPRVQFAPLEKAIGRYENFTRCLHLGSGEYVTVIHDDDLMEPENLVQKVRFLDDHPTVGVVHSGAYSIDGAGRRIVGLEHRDRYGRPVMEPGWQFIRRSIAQGPLVSTPSLVFRRSAVASDGFAEEDGAHCDSALCLRVAAKHDVGYLPGLLVSFRYHGGSASQTSFGIAKYDSTGVPRTTREHVDAAVQAHGRFIERLPPDHAAAPELRQLLRRYQRRQLMRLHVRAMVPTQLVARVRRLRERSRRQE
jgi:glycosyltransferase involved in cell wall biosynthesis